VSQILEIPNQPIPSHRLRILDPQGQLVDGAQPTLESGRTVEALRWMLLSRAFDAKATAMQRQGRIGTFSPVLGQEASVVGSAMALDPATDWVFPSYRELPAVLRQGMPLERIWSALMGKVRAGRVPDGVNVLPTQVALGTQIQHGVGVAWGLKLQRKPGVVMVYFGEGAASEGDFHEACNLAGVQQVPVVLVCQNNQWAISTSRSHQSAGEFYRRAEGYGFPGFQVDGNDLFATYKVAEEAVARARAGEGPTLIECVTYRLSFHNTTDNPSAYLPEGWLEQAEKEDPVARLTTYLAGQGLWDEAAESAMKGEIAEQMDAAVAAAIGAPAPTPEDVFEDAYVDLPPRVRRQREELLSRVGRNG
jgi:pyruvate dehydrogenase E1 component alpha subunit